MIRGDTGYRRHEEWGMRQFIEAFKKELEIREIYEPVLKPGERQQADGPKHNNTKMGTATALYAEGICGQMIRISDKSYLKWSMGEMWYLLEKDISIKECQMPIGNPNGNGGKDNNSKPISNDNKKEDQHHHC
eukprot:Seg2686.9 transcript_id=Seg2686.9/GoldUCD/mRNA.D3Y31 product="hypothetical protein" protein_id=Seg2686.9/GoldUCD/D3Y31